MSAHSTRSERHMVPLPRSRVWMKLHREAWCNLQHQHWCSKNRARVSMPGQNRLSSRRATSKPAEATRGPMQGVITDT